MFGTDQKTHLGYLRYREHINNSHQNSYQSVAAFDPRDSAGTSRFRIFDLDAPGVTFRGILKDYASAVQNLRLVKRRPESMGPAGKEVERGGSRSPSQN
jgi:hypothetical protein